MSTVEIVEMNEAEVADHPVSWPEHFSEVITAQSENLDRQGAQAFACNFLPSKRPLFVPSDTEYLTLELNTALSSSLSHQFGDRDRTILKWQPGDILIYPNCESSRWTWENPHSTCVFFLPYSRLKRMIMEGRVASFHHPVLMPGISRHDTKLRNLLTMIAQEMNDERSNGPLYIASLVDAALIHLARNYVTENIDFFEAQNLLSSAQLEDIRTFILDNLDEPIEVADLADAAGVKLSEFSRLFRVATGSTPYQYVLRERIEWSEELLRTTELSLAEISYASGFSSQSHFTRTFRKQNSLTPLSYRNNFR